MSVETSVFAGALRAFADEPAVHGEDGRVVSYAALADVVDAWRERLGDRRRLVALRARTDLATVGAYLGALAGGHPVVLLGSDAALGQIVDAYDPDVIVDGGAASRPECVERRRGTMHELHPDLALLLSTSGSTGCPKLVRLSRENVQSNAEAIGRYLGLTARDRAVMALPIHYCYGLSVLNSHLATGASVVLQDRSVVDACFWRRFVETSATNFAGVPYTFELLDRVGFAEMDLPRLRFVTQAGGRLAPEAVRRYAELGAERGWQLFVMYGQTEATARMAYLPPARARDHPEAIGVPIPGGSFSIDEPDDRGVGELVYRGPNVMLGYAHAPSDLALGRSIDALRTGDRARRAEDGCYEIVGRTARFVKLVGHRVDLDRVERLLAERGVGAHCTGTDEQMVVAVAPEHSPEIVARLLHDELALPRQAVRVLQLDEVPRLATGKPDYAAILEAAVEPSPGRAPRGASVANDVGALRTRFAEVLDVASVQDDDTFVGLGGDSLSYVELSVALEEEYGALPPSWHVRPVAELERRLAQGRPRSSTLATDVVLRAVATVLILGTHVGLFHLQGGAHLLLAVSGLNFARFVLGDGAAANPLRRAAPILRRIAVPTMACIAALYAMGSSFGLWKLLLVHNYADGGRWRYWYIEALLQLCFVAAVVVSIPFVRRAERARPFELAMAFVGVGLLIRIGVASGVLPGGILHPHNLLWVFAVGWAAERARTLSQRVLVSVCAVGGIYGFFAHDASRTAIVLGGLALLIWLPRIRIPRRAHRPAAAIAASSLYIYLAQFEVYPPLLLVFPPLVVVALTLGIGIGIDRAVRAATAIGVSGLAARARTLREARSAVSCDGAAWS